ncbi:MAG: toll/interleukin-1 receptor domain-containing protein [Crocosphaera sp.]
MTDIFISSSIKDIEWVKRIQEHLAPLLRKKNLSLWSYDFLYPGQNWQETIERAMDESQVIIILISSNHLNSQLPDVELSRIAEKYKKEKKIIFLIIISSEASSSVPAFIEKFQSIGSFSEPLSQLSKQEQEKALTKLTDFIDHCVSSKSKKVYNFSGANIGNVADNIFIQGSVNLANKNDYK